MKKINTYTLDELSNEHDQIILNTQEGVSIGIERTYEGTRLYFYFPNEVKKRTFDYLVTPK